jgi:hypothetical protein
LDASRLLEVAESIELPAQFQVQAAANTDI